MDLPKRDDTLIRMARLDDAPALAKLLNIAGEGIPLWLWRQSTESNEDALSLGAQRAARDSGDFSYTNAHVAEVKGSIAGMLLGYRLPASYDTSGLDNVPAIVRPLIELESLVPGSWYVNAIATWDDFRGHGLGTRLLTVAHRLARSSGANSLSIIVALANTGAYRLYERVGYKAVATRPIIPFPGFELSGDWILMDCPLN